MHRLSVRLAFALLAFTLGVIAASVWRHFQSPRLVIPPIAERQERAYIPIAHYDAARGALQTFGSSDGRYFKKWTITCLQPQGAKGKMEELLKRAERIVSREPVFDGEGRQIGEEVIALFPPNDTENGVASLFHFGESEYLIQVTSTSLQNILDYREDFRH
jgi:hypothetical protein